MFRVKKDKTICMCMIVKDEAHVIERCIRSFAPLVDYYIICDTGSCDNTIEIINKTANDCGLKGEVLQHSWVNFAHNRTLSLNAGRSKGDYLMVIDADEVIKYKVGNKYLEVEYILEDPKIVLPKLDKDCYNIISELGSITYDRLQLMNTRLDWRYESVVHEYAIADNIQTIDRLTDIMNMPRVEGARSKDTNKYFKDALALEKGLLDEPHNSRYYFYLGQSYRDSGRFDKALECYTKRIGMSGYEEEINVCYHQLGHCSKMSGKTFEEYAHYYLEGYNKFPHRLECFYEFIRDARINGKSKLALKLGEHALLTPYPKNDHLFILKDIYIDLFKTEIAQCCIDENKYSEAIIIFKYILDNEDVSTDKKDELQKLLVKLCDFLGKTIQDVSDIKVTYNSKYLLDSKLEINVDRMKLVYIGGKNRDLDKLNIPRISNINSYDQKHIYIYMKKDEKKWNEIEYRAIEDINNLVALVEKDIPTVKKYLNVMQNNFRYISNYINITEKNKDIVLLGVPSIQHINNIIKLITNSNRLFIFVYDSSVLEESTNKLLEGKRHLFISNIQSVSKETTLSNLFSMINIKDPSIGWLELNDNRLAGYLPCQTLTK
jgi:tetratricopeptide (TPR) repeat protein